MNIIDRSALFLIAGYQKYISPRKGFVCAHRVAYGGSSCSQYFCESITDNGLYMAIGHLIDRSKSCSQAAKLLLAAQNDEGKTEQPGNKSSFWTTEPDDKQCLYCLGDGCSRASCCFPW